MPINITASAISDTGLVRQNNEDVFALIPEDKFYVLADGMGGHQAGEVASREAVAAVCYAFNKLFKKGHKTKKSISEARIAIYKAIEHANAVVYKMSRTHEMLRGMGTTLCCLFFHEEGLIYGHVGDSRIYCLQHEKLVQLTQDHSLLRELLDLGQLNDYQASDFLYKNIITKAIGTEPVIEPSVGVCETRIGDRFLMCTDGLSDLLSLKEIETILNRTSDNQEAIEQLVDAAKKRGGHDNVTVVLVEVGEK